MPQTYRPAREGSQHLTLHNVPQEIIEALDEMASYDGRARRVVIMDLLIAATKKHKSGVGKAAQATAT
jgi:hypothetical protein